MVATNLLPYAIPYNGTFCFTRTWTVQPFHDIATFLADHAGMAILAVDSRSCTKLTNKGCLTQLCLKPGQANCLNATRITFDDFITDAISSVSTLKQWGANPDRITVIGHSMGCTIAPIAAASTNANKTVLLMGSAIDIGTTLMRQLSQNLIDYSTFVNSSVCDLSVPFQLELYNEVLRNIGP